MINELLHRDPVPIDRVKHLGTRLRWPVTDWSVASRLNGLFVAAAEFSDVCRDFPIVFVRSGADESGQQAVAPIAVFGLLEADNLYVDGTAWRAPYMPAVLRAYPFAIGRLNAERFAICLDVGWSGVSDTEGEPLFQADSQPTALLAGQQQGLEVLETEIQRTRLACLKLVELDLLRDMRFDATLPDGRKHTVDGFMTVDEAKLKTLPDAVLADLHRQGLLGLIHAHWISMGNMRRLLDWHIQRHGGTPAPVAA